MAMHLTYKDVWLDYFTNRQHLISQLISGDSLTINGDDLLGFNGKSVLKFSRQFRNKIEAIKQSGYLPKDAKVNFILFWKKEDSEHEIKIILPEVCFERQ